MKPTLTLRTFKSWHATPVLSVLSQFWIWWKNEDEGMTESERKAADQGYAALMSNWHDNPYPKGSAEADSWRAGHQRAREFEQRIY